MKIEHNEICLRNVTVADCRQLEKWWNDGSIMAHAGFPNRLGWLVLSLLLKELPSDGLFIPRNYKKNNGRSVKKNAPFFLFENFFRNSCNFAYFVIKLHLCFWALR